MTEPREIAFEEIKVGDDITATHVHSGVTGQWSGVVGCIDGKGLYTAEGGYIGCLDQYTFTLNYRPAPEEPKGLGAIMRTDEGVEYVSVNRELGTRRWVEAGLHKHGDRWALKWSEFDPDGIEVLDEGSYE